MLLLHIISPRISNLKVGIMAQQCDQEISCFYSRLTILRVTFIFMVVYMWRQGIHHNSKHLFPLQIHSKQDSGGREQTCFPLSRKITLSQNPPTDCTSGQSQLAAREAERSHISFSSFYSTLKNRQGERGSTMTIGLASQKYLAQMKTILFVK